ncbi:MAG: hypothetical protein FWH10_01505 [Oscillospiraceae bacterium]|nr:hypothetical protein [Oscillospiraceae bacterium]
MSGEKIIISEELQKEMLEFFLKTSIPRKKKLKAEQEKARLLSEIENQNSDRSVENGSKNGNICKS